MTTDTVPETLSPERRPEGRQRADWVMASIVLAWVGWFGYLAIHRFHGVGFGAFDLGIFDQGLWLISRFEEPFVTLRGLHLFADHASYIMFLLAPLYWLKATPLILVALCAIVPGVAGWLTYRIGRLEGLRPWLALLVGVGFLLHPAVAWTPWDAFHPETLAIALFPASYLAARRGKFGWALLLAALILLVKEDSGLLVAPYALFWWFRWKQARPHAYVLAGLSVAVQALSLLVVLPAFSPTGELIYTGRYSWDLLELATWPRAGYLAAMLIPALFALRAPKVLILALPISLANLASSHGYQHEVVWHYTAYAIAVLAVATPLGAARVVERIDVERSGPGWFADRATMWVSIAVLLAAGTLAVAGPDLTTRNGWWAGLSAAEHAQFEQALAAIPDDAVVSATYNITTHVAHRTEIYMAPNPWRSRYWGAQGLPPLPDPNSVEFLVVDTRKDIDDMDRTVASLIREGWVVEVDGTFTVLRNPNPSRPD